MNKTPRILFGALLAAGALTGGAIAATPDAGTVSNAAPKVTWSGEVTGSWFTSRPVILTEDGSVPCEAPTCDTFALEVADQNDLAVTVTAPAPDDQIILRIEKPDGSYLTTTENTDGKGNLTVTIKNAAKGAYVIDYWKYYQDGPVAYNGTALLKAPAPAAPAEGETPAPSPGAPAPAPAPGAPAPSQPGTAQNIDLTVKVGAASAKKLAKTKKLAAKITVSRQVKAISGVLKLGKKVVGKGSLGATNGAATLNIKPSKKLKAGKYTLVVTATDGSTSASKTVAVKLKK